jgi:hypothetical protein
VKEPRYSVCYEQQETHHTRDSLVVYVQHAGQYDSSSMVQYDRVLDSHLRKLGWLGFCTFGTELPVTCADGVDSSSIGEASLMAGVSAARS